MHFKEASASYDKLRQGSSFQLDLTFDAVGCFLAPRLGTVTQGPELTVRVRPIPGLKFQYGGVGYQRLENLNAGNPPMRGAHRMTLHLTVSAAADLTPGEHNSDALLDYQTVNRELKRETQRLAFQIPVRVAAPSDQVKARSTEQPWNPLNIFLIPVRLVIDIAKILTGNGGS